MAWLPRHGSPHLVIVPALGRLTQNKARGLGQSPGIPVREDWLKQVVIGPK